MKAGTYLNMEKKGKYSRQRRNEIFPDEVRKAISLREDL